MVRKAAEIGAPQNIANGRETVWVPKGLLNRGTKLGKKTIGKMGSALSLIVIEDLPDIANGKPVIGKPHSDLPSARRNSS